ncbi:MAG: EAL domain-containing protein [Erysipelotrichaceae bacterium]|nr:EAL domain-containing protein [Erysipelotrichaceae bacterium]
MKVSEYTIEEMRSLLKNMSGMYDVARVVDPIECRILEFDSDGKITMNKSCYGIWNAGQKCMNCSSALACKTGCHQEKAEHFQDQVYHIQSNPVTLKLPDGDSYEAVVELVNIKEKEPEDLKANDRDAENLDHKAAEYKAVHDTLTKVLTAEAFYEFSREQFVKNPDMAWVMITGNIMDFRLVNTLFGVMRGNEVLMKTASLLEKIAEDCGGLCGRMGGDRFALLIPKELYKEEDLLDTANSLAEEFNSGIYTFRIHFGVYEINESSIPVSVMCGRANTALRTIREDLMRTVAVFDEKMQMKSLFDQEVVSGFDEALKTGQFRMYLQPLVDENGKYLGGEALVRWQRPDGSIIMPGDFIETLENAGRIHELDMYIWECAVRQLSEWDNTDKKDLTISVNVSAKDFYSIDIYEYICELTDRYHVDTGKLRLEITETALLKEPEQSNTIVKKLRDRGFLVEIDDFGKGHSSLTLLKEIHADILKIDMSLVEQIEKDRDRIILESVIRMGKSLGMDVVTEGIETKQQLESLCAMGCSRFQGYYFSRPITVEEFETRYKENN